MEVADNRNDWVGMRHAALPRVRTPPSAYMLTRRFAS